MDELHHLWATLASSPLLPLTLTLVAYQIATSVWERTNRHPLANPVLLAIAILVLVLDVTGTDYQTYFSGAQFIHFLLGPATVALAIPLYRAYDHIRQSAAAIAVATISGCVVAISSSVGIGWLLGGSWRTLLSLAPKSATTPIAMGVSSILGGNASLTAIFVILTGIMGAMLSTRLFNLIGVSDPRARGLATGLAAHGIGTAHKLQIDELTGAFAGLAMGLNGLATAVLAPLLLHWLIR
ncbi:MAG: LrgB family protein [Alphaproteobacteria bacterium]|nr:LrgB family protein [Alphaproteobacteria bacterium]MDE1985598.1 LrgB family protein [Alphaproteobacteria bacterium]MDE2162219.1 LrgB family protein [Alphaproteobacteria bacterium]MDE2265781.1 LrgB family protein [Alphaproteobacteria bacterium]MDE2499578.1 LrgB family protein [Alphaproteobacteria bacterium]